MVLVEDCWKVVGEYRQEVVVQDHQEVVGKDCQEVIGKDYWVVGEDCKELVGEELQDMVMNMGYHLSDEELSIAILHLDMSGDGKIGHGPYKSFRHPAVHALSSFAVLAIQNIRK